MPKQPTTGPLRIAFVLAPGQNHFFVELVEALRFELGALGVPARAVRSLPAERDDEVVVLVPPHEWFALTPPTHHPSPGQLRRALFLCAEQPGTWFFDEDVRLAHEHGATVLDINSVSVAAMRRAGLDAHHAPVGWSPFWACEPDEVRAPRSIDVLHLGIFSKRRSAALARYAPQLARWRQHIVLGDPEGPNAEPAEDFVVDEGKWRLLRDARVLLNIHVDDRPYFEWLRVAQAMSNGVAVVTEHSEGFSPLVPGMHFEAAGVNALAHVAEQVLEAEWRRIELAEAAYDLLRTRVPLRATAERLASLAEEAARRTASGRPATPPAPPVQIVPPPTSPLRFPSTIEDEETSALRAVLKESQLQLIDQRRAMAELRRAGSEHEQPDLERVFASDAYAGARPTVTIAIPMHDEESRVTAALDSCARQTLRDLEVVVVDDESGDASSEVVEAWMREHPLIPGIVVRHAVNRGLGGARNTAITYARAPFAFMLDADNRMYPRALDRLVSALREHPHPSFAYGMLAVTQGDTPVTLLSCFPWRPERLRTGNFIDAMGLWRTEALRDLAGFTTDMRLHGWEDYDLVCRLAERGGHALLVPEILGAYEQREHSMLSVTNISTRAAVSVLVERYPTLMRGVVPPL